MSLTPTLTGVWNTKIGIQGDLETQFFAKVESLRKVVFLGCLFLRNHDSW